MAKARMDLPAFVRKLLEHQDGDLMRGGIRVPSQPLMETEYRCTLFHKYVRQDFQ